VPRVLGDSMTADLLPLALLMGLATYPLRAIPFLWHGTRRMPPPARQYLRLVAPSVLASLAAVSVMIAAGPSGRSAFHVGFEWLAVGLCIAVVALRGNLLLGLLVAAGFISAMRGLGMAP
jgi:branched-subunit amino acid transport protein